MLGVLNTLWFGIIGLIGFGLVIFALFKSSEKKNENYEEIKKKLEDIGEKA